VPPAERVAVFDNDGTLWCEKPIQIEVGFILKRLAEMAEADASLGERQPWKAAHERDYAWLGGAITRHYHGDESDVKVLMGGILRAFGGMTVEDCAAAADEFLGGRHPTLERGFSRMRICPDDRVASLPRGERVQHLHRLGRRPRLHAPGHRGDLRHPRRACHRELERAHLPGGRARRHARLSRADGGVRRRASIKRDWANVFADTSARAQKVVSTRTVERTDSRIAPAVNQLTAGELSSENVLLRSASAPRRWRTAPMIRTATDSTP
jgi:hypothetical protein